MSLARAFTTRRGKQSLTDMGILPQRSNTTSKGHAQSGSIRNKISSPMELTHTTNMLAYNAPDLFPRSASSPTRSSKSDDESSLGSPSTAMSSPPTSPEIPSGEHAHESQHPFGQELAKVSELAEELGVKDKLQDFDDEEEGQLIAKGLRKFKAEDYLAEIHELLSSFMMPEPTLPQQPVWI
ncbi:hypothetical protein ONZ43_g2785 [Nemania bipapillata]|uniref:Uncharacterized protein n=1 Tax=Nemania bipapillata TaxID=110536 RepID=A0ACC2IZG7_9PEZI|nr:hypothetical protein ONZ43_g2785 [Nemania bipapillata]